MEKNDYYSSFPKNYFGKQEERIFGNLLKGENVLVCAPVGFGLKTFINLFLYYYKNRFNLISVNLQSETLNLSTIKTCSSTEKTTVVVLYYVDTLNKDDFENLLSLQFTNKKIVFLCFAHLEPLKNPLDYGAKTEPFFKRFEILTSFSKEKTIEAIQINNKFFNFNILKKDFDNIYTLSGGIPRLIKYICLNINDIKFKVGENLGVLYYDPSILYQLNYLTNLLLSEDTKILKMVGILNNEGKINSLLLKDYFTNYIPEYLKNLFPLLSDYELKILAYLYANKSKLVSFEKIGDLVNMNDYNYSLWAIYKQISRIKPKVKSKFLITSVRSNGYLLQEI